MVACQGHSTKEENTISDKKKTKKKTEATKTTKTTREAYYLSL
jgi:hypothetical protein